MSVLVQSETRVFKSRQAFIVDFKKMGQPRPLFRFFSVFLYNKEKNLVVSGIQIRIFGAVGESADH